MAVLLMVESILAAERVKMEIFILFKQYSPSKFALRAISVVRDLNNIINMILDVKFLIR